MTTFPRWAAAPSPGVAHVEFTLSERLLTSTTRRADDLGAPLSSLMLAAHARVLATLTGEGVVTFGVSGPEGVRPCRVPLGGSWRNLVASITEAVTGRTEAIVPTSFETVFDTTDSATGSLGDWPSEQAGLLVQWKQASAHGVLRLRYRTDWVDLDYARRLADYHLTALASLVRDPDAATDATTLVSPDEIQYQVDAFAGPVVDLPDRRIHELFEERVRAHPHRPAAAQGEREWSYGRLNDRANTIGQALLRSGLRPEDVVAVVTERNLEWMAAVLAILKAGGAYLPLDPHFPPDRIARVLHRADCRYVLTQEASRGALDEALGSVDGAQRPEVFDLDQLIKATGAQTAGEKRAGTPTDPGTPLVTDLGVEVGRDQLAYLYFTSGSTGEPKGAMCEHAGMVNHVLAKIDDLEIGDGDTVAQTASQCFDISLWQLVSALVVGGRTLIVEQETILDVESFVDTIDGGGVAVLQVVPSYLEAVLSYLDTHPRDLLALRCVSATGEALKPELAQRWFASRPGVTLVNAYGLTETSDDTNHYVMTSAPVGPRMPLGAPIQNVRVYVVDEHQVPVPLGAPGEIVFSGVCVGRGYVNDPERTARVYLEDPYRAGERLYRGGDIGRWSPDGTLDFLGRVDHQVKISGFRIEIGEIEDALTRPAQVRDGAVVVTELPGRGKQLVGFYSADQPLDTAEFRAGLARRLPAYMVPYTLYHRATLPLTANGKVDRARLVALATELAVAETIGTEVDAPASPTERRLAAAWAEVLGIPADQIRRHDHFFDLGGTSLTAVKLAIALNRAVTLRDLLAHPVLAEIAALVEVSTQSAQRSTAIHTA